MTRRLESSPCRTEPAMGQAVRIGGCGYQAPTRPEDSLRFAHEANRIMKMLDHVRSQHGVETLWRKILLCERPLGNVQAAFPCASNGALVGLDALGVPAQPLKLFEHQALSEAN